jgi:hypothetical protein
MSRSPARATQADIARAIRAVQQTGARMEIEIAPDGTIRIVPVPEPQDALKISTVALRKEFRL